MPTRYSWAGATKQTEENIVEAVVARAPNKKIMVYTNIHIYIHNPTRLLLNKPKIHTPTLLRFAWAWSKYAQHTLHTLVSFDDKRPTRNGLCQRVPADKLSVPGYIPQTHIVYSPWRRCTWPGRSAGAQPSTCSSSSRTSCAWSDWPTKGEKKRSKRKKNFD